MSRPAPHEVFTPGKPPLDKNNVYVNRSKAEADLKKYVQRAQVPVVWGEYGVGKTSLVQKFFSSEAEDRRLVYIPSVAKLSLSDVFSVILEHLNFSVNTSTEVADGVNGEVGVDFKVVRAHVGGDNTVTRTWDLVVTSPTDVRMTKILAEHRLIVVLDEMHKASTELNEDLVNWIKATRVGAGDFRLILVGTSADAGRLVTLDEGINRFVKEMPVPIMSDQEAAAVVEEGFGRLRLKVAPGLKAKIVRSAAGAPTIVQSLCLDIAESAIADGRHEVVLADLAAAIEVYLAEHGGRLADVYFRAIETTGPRRYRKRILEAIAQTDTDFATMETIRNNVSKAVGTAVPSESLSGPLRSLKTADYGNVLKDVSREVSGTRIHNLSAFSDPMMKSFVRFMASVDDTGLMPSRPQVINDTDSY